MATTAQRLAEYEELYRKAQQYNPNQYQQEFEKAYGEATNYNKDLIEQQAQALGELQAVAPTYRERYMNSLITDPTAQMALIAQARQAPITSYGTAANLLTARGQRYQDILAKALGGYQTAAEQANIAAENAWRLYQDALQQDQFNAQLRASRSGGGGGGSQINLLDLNGNGIIDAYETQEQPEPIDDNKYEIPDDDLPIKDGRIDTSGAGNTFQNRLANQVLNQREAKKAGDVLKAYWNTKKEPFRNIKSFSDVISIPTRTMAANTVIYSDLWNRLFNKK